MGTIDCGGERGGVKYCFAAWCPTKWPRKSREGGGHRLLEMAHRHRQAVHTDYSIGKGAERSPTTQSGKNPSDYRMRLGPALGRLSSAKELYR